MAHTTMELFRSPKFSSRVEELMKQHHVPGIAIAIVHDETTASAGFGHASLDPPKLCTPDTLFDIASASKSLTAAAVGLLVDDDDKYPQVQYEAVMSKLLPDDFVMPGQGYTEGVRVDDILSHRTGMPSHDSSYLGPRATQPDDARSVTRNLRNLPVAAPLRSKYMYCNMMYTVATHLVECMSGLDFANFLDQHFFQPLGMDSTNLQPERARAKGLEDRIAMGHYWEEDGHKYRSFPTPDAPEAQGAGSIVSSVNDYVKWVKAMMNQEGPITKDVYKGLVRARTLVNPDYEELPPRTSPTLYAAGWETYYYRGQMVVVHDGSIDGIGTRHFFLPEAKFGGAIFGNADGAIEATAILAQELIDEVLQVPEDERPDWNEIESGRYPQPNAKEDAEKEREKLCPGIKESEPLKTPLTAYTGAYWNAGYKGMTVEAEDGRLFIDGMDRSFGFTLTFDHVCEQTRFIAHLSGEYEGGDEPLRAEFRFENNRAVKMGLWMEPDLDEYIWFDRV